MTGLTANFRYPCAKQNEHKRNSLVIDLRYSVM